MSKIKPTERHHLTRNFSWNIALYVKESSYGILNYFGQVKKYLQVEGHLEIIVY